MKELPTLTPKEISQLDRQLAKLETKVKEAGDKYDALCEHYMQLFLKRHPEKQEDRMKQILYDAYKKSERSLEQILAYMAGTDPEDIW